MQRHLTALAFTALSLVTGTACATDVTVATWNLGWHLDTPLATRWIAACSQKFSKPGTGELWRPDPAGTRTGWQLRWGRDAKIEWDIGQLPPCDVWQSRHKPVAVTEAALAKRRQQIAAVLATQVNADVIAFQEVSSVQAVREVLPDGGRDYEVCGFTSHKVQRLAFAWRRSVATAVGGCEVYSPLALPERPSKEQPRPGLSVTLRIGGKVTRFMTVHLKSSCVSPLEGGGGTRGQLASDDKACSVLQAQLQPLENWLQERSQGVDAVVMLGDFNRNIAHEASLPANAPVRSRGQASDPYTAGVRSNSLWREVNDGVPAASLLAALDTACPLNEESSRLCKDAKVRVLDKPEMERLTDAKALGCRNPIGLDHIAVRLPGGKTAAPLPVAEKVALGFLGRTLGADDKRPEPLLAVSDHCPLKARLAL
jgi:endonuclease/exonuclease/phosphatase family metal-dependent hydrolase